MAFRIFRNDALQKYRAQFDLAARYAYLAATAYDYETNLLGSDNASGREFLTQIVRERNLGQIIDGEPVPGSRGLAGPMGQMAQNFDVLKSQLGFNNPQIETNRFSLRREAFRLLEDSDERVGGQARERVPGRRPLAGAGVPALLQAVRAGERRTAAGSGDSVRDHGHLRAQLLRLAAGPGRQRLRPVALRDQDPRGRQLVHQLQRPAARRTRRGSTWCRSAPTSCARRATISSPTREWQVVDQVIPVPFPLGANDLDNPAWIPSNDTLSESFARIRRHGRLPRLPHRRRRAGRSRGAVDRQPARRPLGLEQPSG